MNPPNRLDLPIEDFDPVEDLQMQFVIENSISLNRNRMNNGGSRTRNLPCAATRRHLRDEQDDPELQLALEMSRNLYYNNLNSNGIGSSSTGNPNRFNKPVLGDDMSLFDMIALNNALATVSENSYEEFLKLEDVSRGLSIEEVNQNTITSVLNKLPAETDDDHDRNCTICLESFKVGDKVRFLKCFHKFHVDCIDKYFQDQKKCPICRIDITDNPDQ
jgi:hypothetical protein